MVIIAAPPSAVAAVIMAPVISVAITPAPVIAVTMTPAPVISVMIPVSVAACMPVAVIAVVIIMVASQRQTAERYRQRYCECCHPHDSQHGSSHFKTCF
jgi:hypothetical protein